MPNNSTSKNPRSQPRFRYGVCVPLTVQPEFARRPEDAAWAQRHVAATHAMVHDQPSACAIARLEGGCESRMAVMSVAWFVEFRQRLPWLLHVD